MPWSAPLPGDEQVGTFLEAIADGLARQPWVERFPCVLRGATPVPGDTGWLLVDTGGDALQLKGTDHWRLLALSGGGPLDVAGEWDGERVRPLGAMVDGRYQVLWGNPL